MARIGIAAGVLPASDDDRRRLLDQARAIGFTYLRASANWTSIEWVRGRYTLAKFADLGRWCVERGMGFLAMGGFCPPWVRPDGLSNAFPPTSMEPAWRRYWAELFAAGVEVGVYDYEVWNEPNHFAFCRWPDPAHFARLTALAWAEAQKVSPKIRLVVGATAPGSNRLTTNHKLPTPGAWDPRNAYATIHPPDFIAAVYNELARASALGAIGAISCHPYMGDQEPDATGTWSTQITQWDRIRQVMAQHGHSSKPIWGTEFGYRTDGPIAAVSEAEQARLLVKQIEVFKARPQAGVGFVFNWQDLGTWDVNGYLGIHRKDGSPKPAVAAIRELLT